MRGMRLLISVSVISILCAFTALAEGLPTIAPMMTIPPAVTVAPVVQEQVEQPETASVEVASDTQETVPAVQAETPEAEDTRTAQERIVAAAQATAAPADGIVQIKLTAVGDCTLGGDVKRGDDKPFVNLANEKGFDYFFDNVRLLFQNDDITYVNLEGTLTTSKDIRKATFNFKADPSFVQILSGSSVELANLANNHILDYGQSGMDETRSVLKSAGIEYSGTEDVAIWQVKGVTIGSIGFTQWKNKKTSDIVAAIEELRPKCDILLASIHWGVEGRERHSKQQSKQAQAMIDAGADIVIGTHTHTYGGIELYRGKYILYSLGNFCFGGNDDPYKKNTLIFQQVFNFNTKTRAVEDGGISIIPARISGRDDLNDYQPYILTDERGPELLKLIFEQSDVIESDIKWLPESYQVVYGLVGKSSAGPVATAAPFVGAVG